ncbi:MAG: glycosyltransferase, partial [Candidatus Micrarchaeota archaeon]|nr:glycosyltransferase [Candidatus Micrarchaeota archaeon]
MSDYSDVTVIVPTLNEGGNITKLIGILTKSYPKISVIVSDDGSKDGTAEYVRKIGRKNPRIRLLDRKREKIHGLTASVIDAALIAKTDQIVVMD